MNTMLEPAAVPATDEVLVTVAPVMIPTYPIGAANRNPMFLEKRVYQGSSGAVYPHPVIESVGDEKRDQTYTGIWLENRYLRILLLPELGGRVQMAFNKVNGHHFVYYNQVIKPALVGLTGPWISGGIEFNWPQHHRPSTFEPVDSTIEEHADGSKTVWLSEVERMFRTKGMAGFRLYPDRAYLEIHVQLYNRTPFPQTLSVVGEPGRERRRPLSIGLPARRVRGHGPRQARRLHLPHRHGDLLQGRLRARHGHLALQEHPRADLVHGLPFRFRFPGLL